MSKSFEKLRPKLEEDRTADTDGKLALDGKGKVFGFNEIGQKAFGNMDKILQGINGLSPRVVQEYMDDKLEKQRKK